VAATVEEAPIRVNAPEISTAAKERKQAIGFPDAAEPASR
jgi:hypothetical protein